MSEKSDWEQGYDQAMARTYEQRVEARERIAKLEVYNAILKESADHMFRSLCAFMDYAEEVAYKCYDPQGAISEYYVVKNRERNDEP